jgi:iron complex outermembrane recepter protein
MIRGLLNTTALVAITLGFGASAHAQTAASSRLEEVIVTATKTGSSNLQDTPIAITAFTAATLERTGLTDVRDLAGATPGLAIAENTGLSQVYIRGIGSNNIYPGSDPSSTVHLDGVYLARPSSYFSNFLDVERIEVLRGPQGTLYGRNSVGGTINIISRKPDDTFRAKGQFTVGNYALYRAEGFVSGPLVEGKVAGSLSLMKSQRDGYQKNIAPTGNSRVDSEDVWSGRAQLRFTPSNRLDVTVRGDYMDADAVPGGYLKTLVPGPDPLSNRILGDYRTVANDLRQSTTNKEKGIAVDGAYELTDALTLTSLTSYREGDFGFVLDSDAGATAIRRTVLVQNQDQLSQASASWPAPITSRKTSTPTCASPISCRT